MGDLLGIQDLNVQPAVTSAVSHNPNVENRVIVEDIQSQCEIPTPDLVSPALNAWESHVEICSRKFNNVEDWIEQYNNGRTVTKTALDGMNKMVDDVERDLEEVLPRLISDLIQVDAVNQRNYQCQHNETIARLHSRMLDR